MASTTVPRTVRSRLPDPVADQVRSAALVTGRVTARVRPSPTLIVVGAQRSGTTTLFRLLADHPDLERPTLWKGTGYFDDDYARGERWYRAHFPVRAPGPGGRRRDRRAFECSGYYLFHPLAAGRIARDLPGVQVVVMLRDPVERAWSAYRHERARGFETRSFVEAVALEPSRTEHEQERLRTQPGYRSFAHRHHAYLGRGEYAGQVQRYVDALGADRVHLVDAGRFYDGPVTGFTRLQEALGLTVRVPHEVERWNARPAPALDGPERRRLMRHFEPHDEALAALLGSSPSWRARPAA